MIVAAVIMSVWLYLYACMTARNLGDVMVNKTNNFCSLSCVSLFLTMTYPVIGQQRSVHTTLCDQLPLPATFNPIGTKPISSFQGKRR